MIVAIIASVFGLKYWYNENLKPASVVPEESIVTITPGMSAGDVATLLEEDALIRNVRAFQWYVDRAGVKNMLQAGVYRLSPTYSVAEIVDIIVEGRVDTRLVAIPAGLRLDQIEQALSDAGYHPSEVQAAVNKTYDHALLGYKPEGASLEGYIFPESYQVTSDTTPAQLIEHALDEFSANLSQAMLDKIERQGLSLHEAITLASIIQKEASDPEIQPTIAQVFLKRLREGIQLGSDVTFFYASAIAGVQPTLDIDSPYNTRRYEGLPPGPISNFPINALEAVANPSNTDYLYFVAGDDGVTYFSKTIEEHEALTAEHCIELCKL